MNFTCLSVCVSAHQSITTRRLVLGVCRPATVLRRMSQMTARFGVKRAPFEVNLA